MPGSNGGGCMENGTARFLSFALEEENVGSGYIGNVKPDIFWFAETEAQFIIIRVSFSNEDDPSSLQIVSSKTPSVDFTFHSSLFWAKVLNFAHVQWAKVTIYLAKQCAILV
jgi:hypothetical protein